MKRRNFLKLIPASLAGITAIVKSSPTEPQANIDLTKKQDKTMIFKRWKPYDGIHGDFEAQITRTVEEYGRLYTYENK